MPDVGRFFNIDVLAEDYDYQTPYAFSENKVINHIELEGLEGILIGPGGVPVPVVVPQYGSRTTGMHPVGRMIPPRFSRGVENLKNKVSTPSKLTVSIFAAASITAMNIYSNVMKSESDNKEEDKSEIKTGSQGGPTAGKKFNPRQKREAKEKSAAENDGKVVCADCGVETTPSKKREKGVNVRGDEEQVDHIYPKSEGGNTTPENSQILCQSCNNSKSNQLPEDFYKPKK